MARFCKHNYVFTQGYFYCTKCHHRSYGRSRKRKQQKKIGVGISIMLLVGVMGFLFVNGVFEINEKNLDSSMQTIQETTESAKRIILETADKAIPEPAKKVVTDTTDKIQETTTEIAKKIEEDQVQRQIEQKASDEKYLTDIALRIHELINEERTSRGLSALTWNPTITKASVNHSNDMANRNYFQHDSPEGHDFTWRYSQVGFTCAISQGSWIYGGGENIMYMEGYYGVETIASESVDGWMNSQGHRENILTPYFKTEGIGVAKSGNEVYVTQNFC
ncbi:MAG: CAP domain-containing protein [Nitrosopumilus sp.]|uniref:CAP domain-containing protein n=1 Tax=Nitrosopumilus sp. TaxID=2024843 RepID=UPI002431217C|nr:CAP domain-containing protein [Nitrosopumilus sp.]MCV0367470.1 CAP domain-containing protein [Nitrosopumilus sp.]